MISPTILRFLDNELYDIIIDGFEIKYSLIDIQEIEQAKTSYSIPITIPNSPKSTNIFGSLFNVNNISTITNRKIDAKLIHNNKTIINGYCYIDKINPDSITVIMARGDLTIFEDTKNIYLSDLTGFTGVSYTYNNKLWTNIAAYNSTGFAYTDLRDVQFITYDWWGDAEKPIVWNKDRYSMEYSKLFGLNKFTPVIKVKTIFDKVFSSLGYTYTGSSAFINILNNMYMTTDVPVSNYTSVAESVYFFWGQYLKYNNEYLKCYEASGLSKTYNKISTTTSLTTTHNNDMRSFSPFTSQNTDYTITVRGFASSLISSGSCEFFLHKAFPITENDPDPDNNDDISLGSVYILTGGSDSSYILKDVVITPTAEQCLSEYYLRVEYDDKVSLISANLTIKCPNWLYETGNTFTLHDLLPTTYNQSDFINDIFNQFNLFIYANETNKKLLNLMTYNDYYLNDSLDWSNKFSLEELEIVNTSTKLYEKYILGYKDAGDKIGQYHSKKYRDNLNDHIILNNNELADTTESSIKITTPQNVFRKMIIPDEYHGDNTADYINAVGSYVNKENSAIVFGFLNNLKNATNYKMISILYANGIDVPYSELSNPLHQYKLIESYYQRYLTLSPFMITGNTLNLDNPNLFALQFNTADQYSVFTGTTITNNNLYTQFWLQDFETKIFGNRKYLNAKIKLNENDVNIENFRKRIWISNSKIGSSYYRLVNITFSSDPNQLSAVELMSITDYLPTYTPTVPLNQLIYSPTDDSGSSSGGGSSSSGGGSGSGTTYYMAGVNLNLSGTTFNVVNSPVFSGNVSAPKFIEGVTCLALKYLPINNPIATGTLCAPIICATSYSMTPLAYSTISSCTPISIATNYSIAPIVCGTSCVMSPILCATTCTRTPIVQVLGTTNDAINNAGGVTKSNYASQTTGYRVSTLGEADFRYLYVDELHAKAFIADLEQALAGSQIIAKSVAKIAVDFTLPTAGNSGTLVVEEFAGFTGAVFVDGDIIRLRQFSRANNTSLNIVDGWGTVTYLTRNSGVNPTTQSYTFVRSAAPNSGAGTGTIKTGTLALDYGTAGQGLIETTAVDGLNGANSPYQQMLTWTGHPATGLALKMRSGNLAGVSDASFGGALSGYGLYADNVYLKGKIVIAAGSSGYANVTDKPTSLDAIEAGTGTKLSGIAAGATVGATWGVNLNSIPSTLAAPAGTGLFLDSTHLGYYTANAWKTYIDNSGNMNLGDVAAGGAGLSWNQGTGVLNIRGAINITSGSIPYANVTGTPTIPTNTNQLADGANLGGTATWTGVSSKPTALGAPAGAGLYLSSTCMGYYDGGTFQSYIDCTGAAKFVGVVELGTAPVSDGSRTMNFAIKGYDIYENTWAANDSYLYINRIGYNGGTSFFRNLYIGDGKGNARIQVEGGGTTINQPVSIASIASFGSFTDSADKSSWIAGPFVRLRLQASSTDSYSLDNSSPSYINFPANTTSQRAAYLPLSPKIGASYVYTNESAGVTVMIGYAAGEGYKIRNGTSAGVDSINVTSYTALSVIFSGAYWYVI
jgi:hypothetical protein